ncbi:MAG: ribonuclease Z [Lachnoclostridium edouardi]|uniref:ribonuclease Z n=1 Tax=Lachnoclostridium edouardi TaxID=1926283 RepID=UPI0026DB4F43|nr:ribonuclease Z [Lachnoclostridium edouardi]MDO4278991.1 ribonuclease Z [Lachnoclostridium edouardi]
MLDICLLGTGGMMPLPYRFLTAMMARCEGSNLLIDCGEGTQVALKKKGWSPKPIDVICFTHYHADHISGLPGLLLTMGNAERTEPLILIGPKGLEKVVSALRTIAPELPFPLRFIELSQPREQLKIGPYLIDAYKVNHNVTCYGYTVSILRKGRFDVTRANEQQIPQRFWSRLQKGETIEHEGRTLTPDMVLGPERRGIKVAYCTDTRPVPVIAEYAREADLLICEGMYGEDGKESKAREYKHMTMYEAARLADKAQPKEMWLTHYSPSLTKPEEFMDAVRKIFPRTKAAKDGYTAELEFDSDEK